MFDRHGNPRTLPLTRKERPILLIVKGVALLDSVPKRREAHEIPASTIPATRQSHFSWEQQNKLFFVPGWDCHVTPTCPSTRQHIDDNNRSSLVPHPSPHSLIAQLSTTTYPRHPPALGVDPTWQSLNLGFGTLDMILLARPIKKLKVLCLCGNLQSLSQASIPGPARGCKATSKQLWPTRKSLALILHSSLSSLLCSSFLVAWLGSHSIE